MKRKTNRKKREKKSYNLAELDWLAGCLFGWLVVWLEFINSKLKRKSGIFEL